MSLSKDWMRPTKGVVFREETAAEREASKALRERNDARIAASPEGQRILKIINAYLPEKEAESVPMLEAAE